jgi:SMODS and SLOG-associating 2TM effector domain
MCVSTEHNNAPCPHLAPTRGWFPATPTLHLKVQLHFISSVSAPLVLGSSALPATMDNTNERTPLISGSAGESQTNDAYLSRFQQAIGINATSPPHNNDLESARRSAKGIYKEIISLAQWQQRQYLFCEAIFYLAILANIVIGATLASLGPLSKIHTTAITVLGIVNSSTAGILALLKGLGLPDRLRKDQFEMQKVRDFIEETETRLAFGLIEDMGEKELDDIVKEVYDRYNVARDTAEMNRPASYVHQVDLNHSDDRPREQGTGGEGHGVVQAGGLRQSKLAVSSGKGKALVIS